MSPANLAKTATIKLADPKEVGPLTGPKDINFVVSLNSKIYTIDSNLIINFPAPLKATWNTTNTPKFNTSTTLTDVDEIKNKPEDYIEVKDNDGHIIDHTNYVVTVTKNISTTPQKAGVVEYKIVHNNTPTEVSEAILSVTLA